MRYYVVGGAVRDMLLGKHPAEFDIAFDGGVDEFLHMQGNRVRAVGKSTPVYIVNGREYAPLSKGGIMGDLANRDFTINALALDENGVLRALPDSFADLYRGILRHASPGAFRSDFARILRAARFSATLEGFSIHPETMRLMRDAAAKPGYGRIAAERAGKECMKAMTGRFPGTFLRVLAEAHALTPWFTPLENARTVPAGPPQFHGDASVFDHTCGVMDGAADFGLNAAMPEKDRALAVWMALCHDLGKLETKKSALPRHIGHESRGILAAETLAASLRLPALWAKAARMAITLHMKAGQYKKLTRKTRVDLLRPLAASGLFASFCALVAADSRDASIPDLMRNDLDAMLAVTLPEEWRNLGEKSARKLRDLRIAALPDT